MQLLGAAGSGDLFQVRVDGVHLVLNIHVQGGINVITALLDTFQVIVPGLFSGGLPVHAVLGGQVRGHVQNGRVYEPGVNRLGGILVHRGQGAALRAEIVVAFVVEGADGAGIAAVGAEGPAVLRGDALLEDHFLVHGLLILLLGQIALGEHFGQNVQLAVPVPTGTVPLLPLVLKDVGGIGVKK